MRDSLTLELYYNLHLSICTYKNSLKQWKATLPQISNILNMIATYIFLPPYLISTSRVQEYKSYLILHKIQHRRRLKPDKIILETLYWLFSEGLLFFHLFDLKCPSIKLPILGLVGKPNRFIFTSIPLFLR